MSALPELRAEIDATDALTAHIRKVIKRPVRPREGAAEMTAWNLEART